MFAYFAVSRVRYGNRTCPARREVPAASVTTLACTHTSRSHVHAVVCAWTGTSFRGDACADGEQEVVEFDGGRDGAEGTSKASATERVLHGLISAQRSSFRFIRSGCRWCRGGPDRRRTRCPPPQDRPGVDRHYAEAIQMHFLPGYRPELNPDESLHADLKRAIPTGATPKAPIEPERAVRSFGMASRACHVVGGSLDAGNFKKAGIRFPSSSSAGSTTRADSFSNPSRVPGL